MRKIVIGKLSEKPKPNSITVSNIHRLKLRIPNQISFHHEISKIIHDVLLLLLKVKKYMDFFCLSDVQHGEIISSFNKANVD